MASLPVIDIGAADATRRIDQACRTAGFFALTGHGVPAAQRCALLVAAQRFFALPETVKQAVAMTRNGAAWRGWFPLGAELTSGQPDGKEGYYFGREQPVDGRLLHGPNAWPEHVPEMRDAVTTWMGSAEALGQRVMALMAEGLGLTPMWFTEHLTADPTVLFRIFRYPPHRRGEAEWGVGEHTDYGLLTLLATDGSPGLEVKIGGHWVAAPADPELIICNLGDMLDRLTGGRYRSTPHRVRNIGAADRYSMPFFFDPSWDARIEPLTLGDDWVEPAERVSRWDDVDLASVEGTYGTWLSAKVSKVFPTLVGRT
jgi:isopenicillin N synthase-like dioxygenase